MQSDARRVTPSAPEPHTMTDYSTRIKQWMIRWYGKDTSRWDIVREINRLQGKKGTVSLRAHDWLVTNDSKHATVCYINGKGKPFDIHADYKTHLGSFGKTCFDPFRRGTRFFFDGKRERPDLEKQYNDMVASFRSKNEQLKALRKQHGRIRGQQAKALLKEVARLKGHVRILDSNATTIGQLSYFWWAITNGVHEHAKRNLEAIEAGMAAKTREQKANAKSRKRRRQEISKSDPVVCTHYHLPNHPVNIVFKKPRGRKTFATEGAQAAC